MPVDKNIIGPIKNAIICHLPSLAAVGSALEIPLQTAHFILTTYYNKLTDFGWLCQEK